MYFIDNIYKYVLDDVIKYLIENYSKYKVFLILVNSIDIFLTAILDWFFLLKETKNTDLWRISFYVVLNGYSEIEQTINNNFIGDSK